MRFALHYEDVHTLGDWTEEAVGPLRVQSSIDRLPISPNLNLWSLECERHIVDMSSAEPIAIDFEDTTRRTDKWNQGEACLKPPMSKVHPSRYASNTALTKAKTS